jgi:hypothetical protein
MPVSVGSNQYAEDIITARCQNSILEDLDWNAWYFDRRVQGILDVCHNIRGTTT